jgi:hypothetical protein
MKFDSKLYRKLSEPTSIEEANANLNKFHDKLEVLRADCHIADLVVIVRVAIETGEGEGYIPTEMQFGNLVEHEAMVARSLGVIQGHRQMLIAAISKAALNAGRKEGL